MEMLNLPVNSQIHSPLCRLKSYYLEYLYEAFVLIGTVHVILFHNLKVMQYDAITITMQLVPASYRGPKLCTQDAFIAAANLAKVEP